MRANISRSNCCCRLSSSTISTCMSYCPMVSSLWSEAQACVIGAALFSLPFIVVMFSPSMFSTISTGMITVNFDPLPLREAKLMLPPSRCTISRVIESPSPTPSLPCASGRRVKALNTRCCSSGVIPQPVSVTLIVIFPLPIATATVTSPLSVYLMALPTRLFTTCFMRNASDRHIMFSFSMISVLRLSFLAKACGIIPSVHSLTSEVGAKLASCSSAFPLSS